VNAVWDLYAKVEGKPLWKLLADMTPEQLVSCVDFRYITDAVTPDDALTLLREHEPTRAAREADLLRDGYPAYTTSAGWLGYPDADIRRLCREGIAAGWTHFKIKVGADREDDLRRCALVRQEIGPDRRLMLDANQIWDVNEAIARMRELARFDPWWIEEPTSPDDVLGHAAIARAIAPIGLATGEQCQNRILFKQFMRNELLPSRRLPPWRRQRGTGCAAVGGEVRNSGVSPRRRRRSLRVRAALGGLRLLVRERLTGEPHRRVRGSPARTLHRSCGHAKWPLHAAPGTRL
jgi:hypothetical protein